MEKQRVSFDGNLPLKDAKDLVRMLRANGCTDKGVRKICSYHSESLKHPETIEALRKGELNGGISIYGFIAPP